MYAFSWDSLCVNCAFHVNIYFKNLMILIHSLSSPILSGYLFSCHWA